MVKDQIPEGINLLRKTFSSGRTRSLAWRKKQLHNLNRALVEQEEKIACAIAEDFGKAAIETWLTEIRVVKTEIDFMWKNLSRLMKHDRVATPRSHLPGSCLIRNEPKGVVLIIGPWNYPFSLIFSPLVAALAAGNCAVIKPSELAPATSKLTSDLVASYCEADTVQVYEGGVEVSTDLLEEKFDHIFFTGSTQVGKIVMRAAAEHLTPVTLELGGKSPCIVDDSANLKIAAKRIAWGKFINAGQTCVAPDYILVKKSKRDALVNHLKKAITGFYGKDARKSPDYARIINGKHFQRLKSFLSEGKIVFGGFSDSDERYIEPTIIVDPPTDSLLCSEEIFGPILPVLTFEEPVEAVEYIRARPHPLALYIFANDKSRQNYYLSNTQSGGACINDTVMHLGVDDLPFGGIGESGMGAYHGRSSFEEFTHSRSVYRNVNWLDLPLRYPPYSKHKRRWIEIIS